MEETEEAEQKDLDTPIGNKEVEKLKPAKVTIESAKIEIVGDKKLEKVTCLVKHPDSNEPIKISAVKMEKFTKLKVVTLWVNKDVDGNLQKGSALVDFLVFADANTIGELKGKEVETAQDDAGYLIFKAY